jgi:multidrug efflux system outer membrane protein
MRKMLFPALLAIICCGCMVGPNYQRPPVDSPSSWRFEEKRTEEIANIAWWEQFDDAVLNELIRIGLQENKDIKIAAARVEEFTGRYGIARAPLFPQVGAGASASKFQVTERAPTEFPSTGLNPAENYQLSVNLNWELDLWGKLRRATEAARADLLATEEARRAVVLSLVTSVAAAYVNLRNLDRQLEIAERTAKSREDSYRLFQLRFQGGVVSELELNQIQSLYEQAQATIPFLEKAIAQQENAINVLLGRNPGPTPRGKKIEELALPAVPAGLPSDLLNNRPDIRQAEQTLIAANARIGAARAQYFPTISLTGLFGYASTELSNLFTGPANIWSFAAPATVSIFTAGSIRGQVKAAEAVQQQALWRYQQTIQVAFREVEDALVDQRRSREQLAIQARQIESLRNYARIARLRFDNGYTSYIEVLDSERSLFNAELSQAQTSGSYFQALVNLYKAMGGGWITNAVRMGEEGGEPPPSIPVKN